MKISAKQKLTKGNFTDVKFAPVVYPSSDEVSLSGAGAEALLPVQLDPKTKFGEDYANVFYPRPRPVKGATTERKHWAELCKYLVEVSAFINGAFGAARYLIGQSQHFATIKQADQAYFTQQFMNEMLNTVVPFDGNDKEALKASQERIAAQQRAFVANLGSGTKHIIKPSKKFKGGFDIIYSGLPGTPGTPASFQIVPTSAERPIVPDSNSSGALAEMRAEGGMLALPLGKACLEMCTILLNTLVNNPKASKVETSAKRMLMQVPLEFDFAAAIKAAIAPVAAAGIDLSALYKKCPAMPDTLRRSLGGYFSLLVVREANPQAVRRMVSDRSYNLEKGFSEENHITSPTIGLSFVAHIPAPIVEFITQTKPGGKIPMTALNTWASIWSRAALRVPRQKAQRGQEAQSRITLGRAPRYVLPATATADIAKRRKSIGMYTEDGRTNSEDMYVSNIGTLNYCPKSSELSTENAKNYEKILEDALQISFDAGSPLSATQLGETNPVFSLASPEYKEKIAKLKADLTRYKGSMQAFSWDYNMILTTAMSDPEKLNVISLSGAARPDELGISDYLKKPWCEAMKLLFVESRVIGDDNSIKAIGEATFGKGGSTAAMLKTSLFQNTFTMYAYLIAQPGKVVPSFKDLVQEAAKDLGYTGLTMDEDTTVLEKGLYAGFIKDDLSVPSTLNDPTSCTDQVRAIEQVLSSVLRDSAGSARSNLAKLAYGKNQIPADDPHFFDPESHTLAEFKNVYNYLGGRVFYQMLRHITLTDKKNLLVLNTENPVPFVNFSAVVREVMPLATILTKYVTSSEDIYEKAEKLAEGNTRDSSIGPSDIHVPGSAGQTKTSAGFQMFPHQVEGQQYLRNDPRFAVLDVAPGGGKTIAVVTDVGCLIHDKKIRRPLIICPNGLVKNWVEDLHKVTKGQWNAIPITKDTYRLWGDERLTKMILKAPPNTLVIVGMSVLKLDQYPIVIGNHVEKVSETLEFIKKFGFDYVAIDEAHRVKNPKSAVHRAVKQICTSSSTKFIRLATGTLISNNLTDIVGQSSMFNAQIFRTPEEYMSANQHQVGDTKVYAWNEGTAQAARAQLSRHAAVITAKRKEWAFMLPLPIEEFIPVGMTKRTHYAENEGDVDGPVDEKAGGNAHQIIYNTVLTEVMDEIRADAEVKKLLSGKDDDAEDDDEDDDDGKGELNLQDLDDATLAELQMKLNPYLQRLEMLLTDPLHSDVGQIYFNKIGLKNFVSNKVLKVIERIRLNFKPIPWEKGKTYELRDICDVGDQRFVLMPPKGAKHGTKEYEADYVSKLNPTDDPRWKPEPRGKVIVFCRYKSTVNCIFENLPPDLKKMAVKFHGDIAERWDYLDAFKSVPVGRTGVQILIANEMSISEGHNLQMANRLIRVEAPWAPGELDQAASRIFRPDPSGEFSRENIYLDWILTDNSLEVAKMGRLISKMIIKAQFDESSNPLYDSLRNFELPLISMSLKTIEETPTLDSIGEYTHAYGELIRIQGSEFAEMRATKPSKMMSIPETKIETLEGQGIIEYTPYVSNMDVPDRHNFGLLKLTDFLQDTSATSVQEVLRDPRAGLVGKYAHTEMGNGTIINVTLGDVDKKHPEAPRKISRVWVKIEGVEDVYKGDPSYIHLATNLNAKTIKEFALKQPWATKADQARADRLERAAEKRAAKESLKDAKRAKKEEKILAKLKEIEKLKKQKSKQKVKPIPEPEPEEEENNNIELYPVVYNGFLAVEAILEDDTIDMTPYGFSEFGSYAYCSIKDINSFEAVLTWLKKSFTLPKSVNSQLESLRPAFIKKFASEEVHNVTEFKNFYRLRHTASKINEKTGKQELKVYPVILNNVLMLNIDLATNPKFKRMLNKVVPGSRNVKFTDADGLHIAFLKTKSECLTKLKELVKEGFEVTNVDEFKDDLKALNLKMKNI